MEREEGREWGERECVGRRGRNGNFYKLINFYKLKKNKERKMSTVREDLTKVRLKLIRANNESCRSVSGC